MDTTTTAQAKKNPGKFGHRTGVFQSAKPEGFNGSSVRHPRPGTKTARALAALAAAGDKGLTQSEFLGHTWRLAACIFELRSLYGCDISAMLVPAGAGRRVARYVLRGVRHEH